MPVDYGLLEAEQRAARVSSMKGSLIVGHFTSYRGVDILTKFLKPLFQYLEPSVFLHTVDLKMRHLPCKKRIYNGCRLTWIEEANCHLECSKSYWLTWKCLRSWSSVPSPSHSLLSVESALSLRARRALVLRSMRRGFWWVWLWTCWAGGSFVRSSSSSAITAVTAVPLLLWHPPLPKT